MIFYYFLTRQLKKKSILKKGFKLEPLSRIDEDAERPGAA